jgi:hypothetical protein
VTHIDSGDEVIQTRCHEPFSFLLLDLFILLVIFEPQMVQGWVPYIYGKVSTFQTRKRTQKSALTYFKWRPGEWLEIDKAF